MIHGVFIRAPACSSPTNPVCVCVLCTNIHVCEKAPRILPVRRSLLVLVGRKTTVVKHQLFPQKPPGSRLCSRAQGFSTPLARRRPSCPPPSPNMVRTHPIECYQALRDCAPCLSRAATPPEGHHVGAPLLGTPSSANNTAAASQPTG